MGVNSIMTMQAVEVEIEDDVPDTMAIASTPCSPLPATTSALLLRWFEELLRVLSSILWHALLAVPLHLTRCRKIFFKAD